MAEEIETGAPLTSATPSVPTKRTYEEFLAGLGEDTWAEWINGEVILMSPISKDHQDLGGFLLTLIRLFVEARRSGIVLYEPFQMKTGPNLPGRSPDILFVTTENLARVQETHVEGPADLAVEIISPESRARDRGEKFYEYEQGGVREYWLIDPLRKQAEFYSLGKDGIYRPIHIGSDSTFRSVVLPGFWLKVDWLWQGPLPPVMTVLKEWRLV